MPHDSEHCRSRGEEDAEGEPGGTPYQHGLLQGHAVRSLMRIGHRSSPEQASSHAVEIATKLACSDFGPLSGADSTTLPGSSPQASKPAKGKPPKVFQDPLGSFRKLFPEVFRSPPPEAFRKPPPKFFGSTGRLPEFPGKPSLSEARDGPQERPSLLQMVA